MQNRFPLSHALRGGLLVLAALPALMGSSPVTAQPAKPSGIPRGSLFDPAALVLRAGVLQPQPHYGNESAITPDRLKSHLEFIASDEMEGRDTPSRGLDTATLYVATQLKLWGAQPAGDGCGDPPTSPIIRPSI